VAGGNENRDLRVYYRPMISDPLTGGVAPPSAQSGHPGWPYRRSATLRYAMAILAVTIAFGVRYLVYGELENRVVFTFFVPAAMVAAWYGGLGPGMLATLLGLILGDLFFLPPRNPVGPIGLGIRQSMGVGAYAVTTMLCVMLCERLHDQIRRFERALEQERHHLSSALHPDAPASALPPGTPVSLGWPFQRRAVWRYGVAIAMVILAFGLRYWLYGTQDHRFPFLFFVPAAIIAAWYGGMAPGLLATAAGLVLGDYFFLSEHEAMGAVRENERIGIGLYALTTTLCVILFENLHNRIRRLEHALDRAQHHHHPHADTVADPVSAFSH
jgi:K+-sensing histidine kinase KdpD